MEVPGQTEHPDTQAGIDEILAACEQHNKAAACLAGSVEIGRDWVRRGFRMQSNTAPLSDSQVQDFRDRGWIVIPEVFSAREVETLGQAACGVLTRPGPEVGREDDGAPSICWGLHLFDERLRTLSRHPPRGIMMAVFVDDITGANAPRPDYYAARDFSPIQSLPADCLAQYSAR